MAIRALLFDFGGTLDADGRPWVDRFDALYRAAGGAADSDRFRTAFADSDQQLMRRRDIATLDYTSTARAQWALLVAMLPDGGRLDVDALAARFTSDATAVARRNVMLLRQLRSGCRLAVVSNYQGNLQPCLEQLALAACFDVVSDSHVVGARKPDPRIFALTLAALRCRPDECWMIGDSPRNDIAAARALGMRTCWVAPAARPTGDVITTARIARLTDLPRVLAH